MINNLIGQINIIKAMNFKPNYSELAIEYGIDRFRFSIANVSEKLLHYLFVSTYFIFIPLNF